MKVVFSCIALIVSGFALAGAESISLDKKITQISTYDHTAVIYYSPAQGNSQNCTNTTLSAVKIDLTVDSGRQMLATAMAAASTQSTVGFGIDGCFEGNLPKVYRVDVKY